MTCSVTLRRCAYPWSYRELRVKGAGRVTVNARRVLYLVISGAPAPEGLPSLVTLTRRRRLCQRTAMPSVGAPRARREHLPGRRPRGLRRDRCRRRPGGPPACLVDPPAQPWDL